MGDMAEFVLEMEEQQEADDHFAGKCNKKYCWNCEIDTRIFGKSVFRGWNTKKIKITGGNQ